MNLILTRLTDVSQVKQLVSRDVLYKTMLEMEHLDGYVPDLSMSSWLLVNKDGLDVGILMLRPFGGNCINFHGGVFKEHRNQGTAELVKECLELVRKQFHNVFITTINEHNIISIKLVKKIGLIEKTRIVNGYKTGDLIIFGEK